MHDEFLQRLRQEPRPEFAARLRRQLENQARIRPRHRAPSRGRGLIVLLLLGGAAFALTLALRGAPLLRLFHHSENPVATARTTRGGSGVGSHAGSATTGPSAARSPSSTPVVAPAQSVGTARSEAAPASAEPAPWQYFLRGDSAPLLRGWIHPGLPAGWRVHDGVLSKSGAAEDLESTLTYRDFVLELQWKIGQGGDSGIFYRATHEYPRIYMSGPEYQLLDDDAHPAIDRTRMAGAVYGLYPSPPGVVQPHGHWNSTVIMVRGDDVQYWLNGRPIIHYTLGSDDWMLRVRDSGFGHVRDYGRASEGMIGLQGGNRSSLEIRKMRIRVLP